MVPPSLVLVSNLLESRQEIWSLSAFVLAKCGISVTRDCMSLNVVATPIGPLDDITLRALQCLKDADLVIGEERKVTLQRLKHWGLLPKPIRLLNEHTEPDEVEELADLCRTQNVALISDCGTPGFCDPGADLVRLCREKKIEIRALPGASSLLSL